MRWDFALNFFIALLAIVNPIAKVPLWISASKDREFHVRWRLALLVTLTALAILMVFLFFGQDILDFLGIELAAFKVGGGLVILQLGFRMLNGNAVNLKIRNDENEDKLTYFRVAEKRFRQIVIPIAVPIMAGPGSITTVIIFGVRSDGWSELGILSVILVFILAINYFILVGSQTIEKYTGETVLHVITRVFGLLVIAIAMQIALEGLGEVFPSWLDETSEIIDDINRNPGATK